MINQYFLFDFLAARGQGISQQDALRLGLIGSLLRPPFLGLLLAVLLAQRQASAARQLTAGTTTGTTTTGTSGTSAAASGITVSKVPSFVGDDLQTVKDLQAAIANINIKYDAPVQASYVVKSQDPPVGTPAADGTTVTIKFGDPLITK